ncbi:MAG: 4Fe-4S dicluster domain-containing protein [Candidatus Lokiarchaeota archaeon]|nr:4Fe-4S dicluster domain-containing protein [Candidatus Lokiarchaeota archaeon]MBD3340507.1 4Fe-4S dicluster domain-containing protein [Candidatus Lokiarchaeota archaeon]
MCLKHGANGKWYMNARNYLKQTYEDAGSYDYLEEFWGNIENSNLNKVYGLVNMKWMSKYVNTPIIGSILKWYANKGFLKDGRSKKLNINAAQGHFGQVIPLEDSKIIVQEKADLVVKAICPCKFFNKGEKKATCLGFSPLAEILPKLPRFIPENNLEILDGEQANHFLEETTAQGYVHTIWCGPVPSIVALCSCEVPSCGALRLRTDFDIKACWKGEYIADVKDSNCIGCKKCYSTCQFNAISYSEKNNLAIIDVEACFGCGNCVVVCENNAISLIKRPNIIDF